jgi:hypothetical protein
LRGFIGYFFLWWFRQFFWGVGLFGGCGEAFILIVEKILFLYLFFLDGLCFEFEAKIFLPLVLKQTLVGRFLLLHWFLFRFWLFLGIVFLLEKTFFGCLFGWRVSGNGGESGLSVFGG